MGGACVSIYSNNQYVSNNLDYVSPASTDRIIDALNNLGFIKKKGFRQFVNVDCPFYVEFPRGPVSIGNEVPITKFSSIKSLKLFTPTDCVKDRLAAFYHWNDLQSLSLLRLKSVKIAAKSIIALKQWMNLLKLRNARGKIKAGFMQSARSLNLPKL